MKNTSENKKITWSESLLSTPTPARASGAAFSLAAILPSVLAVVLLIIFAILGLTDYQGQNWYIYVSYLLSPLAFAIVLAWYLRYTKTPLTIACQSQKCQPKYFILAILLQIGLLSLSELNGYFLKFLARFGYEDSGVLLPSMDGIGFIGVIITVAVLPSLFEEVIFRGVLLDGLKPFGKWGAAFICGALFAIYHQNPAQTIYQFCCGVAFALVALRAGSILPTVLSHFLNNAFILILTKCGVNEFVSPAKWIIFAVSATCLVLSFVWILRDNNKLQVKAEKQEKKRFFICASVGIVVVTLTWILTLITGF